MYRCVQGTRVKFNTVNKFLIVSDIVATFEFTKPIRRKI